MKKKNNLEYFPPVVTKMSLESEGIFCLSAYVTVDEHRNMNADDPVSEPYLEDPIVF